MRRFFLPLGAAVAVAALAYCGVWYYFARALATRLPDWTAARHAEGYDIAWTAARVGGFPFALTLSLDGASLEAAGGIPYALAADRLVLETRPWDWRAWRFSAPQGGRISLPQSGAEISSDRIAGNEVESGDGIEASVTTGQLTGSAAAAGFSAASLTAHLLLPAHAPQGDRDLLASVSAALANADLPRAPLGRLDALSLALTMRGPMPRAPLETALAAWRDAGGVLDIDGLDLTRGAATADITGTLALDEALQPEGAMTATVLGLDQVVDALVAAGTLKPRFAGFAKSVLGAISVPGAAGTVRFPLTVQDQRLYVGPAQVAVLPHLDW